MLKKLKLYGCDDNTVTWFKSYLTERKQCVINENYKSEMKETTHGVPQGSILGPLLFLIYINDFSFCVPNCNVNMYADDTTIYIANSNVTEVEYILQRDIDVISNWCDNSRLVINIQKSCSMLLCSPHKLRHLDKKKLNISLQGSTLVCENNQKILGVTIDSKLIFDEHIKLTCAKIASLSGLLWRIRNCLTLETKLLYYNSYVLPKIDYCLNAWGHCSKTQMDRIFKLQKRIIRIIANDTVTDINVLFKKYRVMSVYSRVKFQTAMLVFKCLNGIVPNYLQDSIQVSGLNHHYNLRSSGFNLMVPKPKTEMLRKCFSYAGPVTWNSLPEYIKEHVNSSLSVFKYHLKKYFNEN